MVRRGFESVRGLCKSAGASAARWSAISTATRAGARSGAIPHSGWTGNSVELEGRVGGGACGEWVDRDGRRAIEPTGVAVDSPTTK
jgi:hypothetical protein